MIPICTRMPPIRIVMPRLRIDRMVMHSGREMPGIDRGLKLTWFDPLKVELPA